MADPLTNDLVIRLRAKAAKGGIIPIHDVTIVEAADEIERLRASLRGCVATIDDYLAYTHDGDPWAEDARAMGEMDINRFQRDGRLERAKALVPALLEGHKP